MWVVIFKSMVTTRNRRKRPRRKKKRGVVRSWLPKAARALFFMALGAVFYALFFHGVWGKKWTQTQPRTESNKPEQTVKKRAFAKAPQTSQPGLPPVLPYEIYPEKKPAIEVETVPVIPPAPDTLPRIAIIIDDLGHDRRIAEKFLDLPGPLTFSILPHLPHTRHVVKAARAKKWEVMVHLPMEPQEYPSANPGLGVLLTSMTPDVLIDQLRKDLAAIPGAVGVNNHMGSRFTSQSVAMNQVFSELKRQNLFFIDSLTSGDSVAREAARLYQVPFGQRQIFLDHHPNRRFIEKQIKLLQKIAQRHSLAVGIGHPYQITWQVLSKAIPQLKENILLIPASQAVGIIS